MGCQCGNKTFRQRSNPFCNQGTRRNRNRYRVPEAEAFPQDVIEQSDKIVTMGCLAKDVCPAVFLPKTEDWAVEDPVSKPMEKFGT
ncbi:MAG: hypothetical protein V3W09_04635 [Nitrososphaerales archaeon]